MCQNVWLTEQDTLKVQASVHSNKMQDVRCQHSISQNQVAVLGHRLTTPISCTVINAQEYCKSIAPFQVGPQGPCAYITQACTQHISSDNDWFCQDSTAT